MHTKLAFPETNSNLIRHAKQLEMLTKCRLQGGTNSVKTLLLNGNALLYLEYFFAVLNVVLRMLYYKKYNNYAHFVCNHLQPLHPFWLHMLQRFNLVKSEYLLRHNSRKLKDFTLLYMLTNANFFPKRTR